MCEFICPWRTSNQVCCSAICWLIALLAVSAPSIQCKTRQPNYSGCFQNRIKKVILETPTNGKFQTKTLPENQQRKKSKRSKKSPNIL